MTKLAKTKKPVRHDWHSADIKAELEKAGWSLRRLSVARGLAPQSLQKALHAPWPRAEALIADALGLRPRDLWPTRYHVDGTPKRGRPSEYTKSAADDAASGTRSRSAA